MTDESNVRNRDASTSDPGPDRVYCRDCGAVISERAEICPECGVRQRPPPSSSADDALDDLLGGGNPFVAAVLSALFPGLGQLYNRQLAKGLAFIVGSFLAMLSMMLLVGFLLFPLVWLYAIYDAYAVADRRSGSGDDEREGGGNRHYRGDDTAED